MNGEILSFDIGEISLTYCKIIFSSEKKYRVKSWELNSIRKKSNETSSDKLDNLLELLKDRFPVDNTINYVVIENQGTFRPFMKSIQTVIYTYFKLQDKHVTILHAINKSDCILIDKSLIKDIKLSKSAYKNNKNLSIAYTMSVLPDSLIKKYIIHKDHIADYSDALIQAIYFLHKFI